MAAKCFLIMDFWQCLKMLPGKESISRSMRLLVVVTDRLVNLSIRMNIAVVLSTLGKEEIITDAVF